MTDFLKIAKSIVVHFAHICAYGVETVNVGILSSCRVVAGKFQSYYDLQVSGYHESSLSKSNL